MSEPSCSNCGAPCGVRCYVDVLVGGKRESVCSRNCYVARQEKAGFVERRGSWVPRPT